MNDPVLDTLLWALSEGYVAHTAKTKTLFLRARLSPSLCALGLPNLTCQQSLMPEYAALKKAGLEVVKEVPETQFEMSLVLVPRQREEGRALLARAVRATQPGGTVLVCVSNLEGAKTVESDLKSLLGEVQALSKNKCRAFWGQVDGQKLNRQKLEQWSLLDEVRLCDNGFLSRPGLFSWDRIDKGSKLLVAHLPSLKGKGADLGCGYGYLMNEALRNNPAITDLTGFEAEARAVEVAAQNLLPFMARAKVCWADVAANENSEDLLNYDFILSNPPFHTDRADRHDLGQAFIKAAAKALKKGGQFHMVANRHLPYEATLKAEFKTVTCVFEGEGYKVYRAQKA